MRKEVLSVALIFLNFLLLTKPGFPQAPEGSCFSPVEVSDLVSGPSGQGEGFLW